MFRRGWLLTGCLATACYSGVSFVPESAVDTDAAGGDGDGSGEGGTDGSVDADGTDAARLWRLSASQYERTVEVALGLDVDLARIAVTTRSEDFINYADASGVSSVLFANLEEDLYSVVSANVDTIATQLPCSLDALDSACLTEFLGPFVLQAHRTDTTPSEPYVQLFDALRPTHGASDAFASVVVAVLLSPKAFFRTELGPDDAEPEFALGPFEIAENLAYTVWNGPPDAELLALAKDGSITDPDVFGEQLDRMLASPEGNAGMVEFLSQWLGLSGLLGMDKDPIAFPEFDQELKASMLQSTLDLFEYVLDEEGADFRTLLTTQKAFADDRLAAVYGVSPPATPGGPVELPASERRGIFTSAAVVVAMSDASGTAVIYRGKALLNRVICKDLPPRPAGVEATPPPGIPDDATTREKLESLEETAPCDICHVDMHPFSFAMEQYDPIGRFRSTQNGKPIDPSGALSIASEVDPVAFSDIRALIDALADRPDVYDCFVKQGIRYTFGRSEAVADANDFERLAEVFRDDRDIRGLFRELVTAAAFRGRAKVEANECFSP